MRKHFFQSGKEKYVDGIVPGYIVLCKICKKPPMEHSKMEPSNWKESIIRSAKAIQKSNENYPIKKIIKHRSVKLTSTLSGQREIIREHTNKINEIIEWINSYE